MVGRMPWLPLYRVWGKVIYKEEGSPDRGVVSLREWPSYLGLQVTSSCGARPGVVVVMVLCPRRGKVWCGATVLTVAALLARLWFASHPVRRGLRRGLRHRLLMFWGRRTRVGGRP